MELKKHITDEKTGISYTLVGDYYLPDLRLPEQEEYEIGRFGRARRKYLREHHNPIYESMLMSCELEKHLLAIKNHGDSENIVTPMARTKYIKFTVGWYPQNSDVSPRPSLNIAAPFLSKNCSIL